MIGGKGGTRLLEAVNCRQRYDDFSNWGMKNGKMKMEL